MRRDSPLRHGDVTFPVILLLVAVMNTVVNAQPIDYEDVGNLLPTIPQTTNDTLAAVVKDPVVQDAVQNAVGQNGTLEGLVVKKKVMIMPATEPTKVMSQREQVLVVPMEHLEDVRKNITGAVNAETEEDKDNNSQSGDSYEALNVISEMTREPILPTDETPSEIESLLENPSEKIEHLPATISVPIIALLDPARINEEKIDVPIAAMLSKQDDTLKSQLNQLEDRRDDEIQRNVQDYIDGNAWSVSRDNWRLASSEAQARSAAPYDPALTEEKQRDVSSENSLPVIMPRLDIATPLFWTSDMDIDYPKDSRDMDVAADIVFRPLFRFRQEAQRRSWRRGPDNDYRTSTYRRYNPYNSYPRRTYRYRPRYSDDYY